MKGVYILGLLVNDHTVPGTATGLVSIFRGFSMKKREKKEVMIDITSAQGRSISAEFLLLKSLMFLTMLFFSMVLTQVH